MRLALRAHLPGRRITAATVRRGDLRHPIQQSELETACVGKCIRDVRRRGKYLIIELETATALVAHLGMSGQFRIVDSGCPPAPHEHIVWTLDAGRSLRFIDPRRFGMIRPAPLPGVGGTPDLLAHLGPEPLDEDFSPAYLARVTGVRGGPIKTILLDQTVVAGLGNIYVNEALFRAGTSPRRLGRNLGNNRCSRIVASVREVLQDALACGGTTIRDFQTVDGSQGNFTVCLDVYDRHNAACHACGKLIRRIVQAGRSTFYCPACQR